MGECVYQVALGGFLHPGANQGDELTEEPQAVISVAESREGRIKRHRRLKVVSRLFLHCED
jgi:hypothetical protein